MQHRDEALLENIFTYLEKTTLEEMRSPSMSEIAKQFGISRSGAYNYVMTLSRRGRIDYDGKSISTEKLRKVSPSVSVPCFLSSIPCGPLEQLDGSVDGYVSLPTTLFGQSRDLFIVRACGDSMTGAGIDDGDLIVMKNTREAKEGDIIAALDENGANTLKRLIKKKGRYVLHPENDRYSDIAVKELVVQGVASFIIKSIR